MDVIRDHDKFYLNEDRKLNTKEYFKFIVNHSSEFINYVPHNLSILDIGCATGDFVFYLSKTFPQAKLVGIDVMQDLLERAKNEITISNSNVRHKPWHNIWYSFLYKNKTYYISKLNIKK